MITRYIIASVLLVLSTQRTAGAQDILVPMDDVQADHLKAYGVTFWALERKVDVDWLLNYRGGSFLMAAEPEIEAELRVRGVSYEVLGGARTASILSEVESDAANTSVVRLEKPPRIAVYAPEQTLPWDDAVLLALTYAEVPYDMIYDDEVLEGALDEYDWLHLHHEDFTGQFGKFFSYRATPWYIEQQRQAEMTARRHGFRKVSELKLAVVSTIKEYVGGGGFLFA
ncbi:MAG: asparagine synthetase B, partial [Bacteroidetes bacterium]|nr:asparagine synthetase B [Bacteroidota bacterium]